MTITLRHQGIGDAWRTTPDQRRAFVESQTGQLVRRTYVTSGLWYQAELTTGQLVVVYC